MIAVIGYNYRVIIELLAKFRKKPGRVNAVATIVL